MKLDLKTLKDASGKAIDTSKLGDGLDVILTAIAAQIPDPLDGDAIGKLVTAQVEAATGPLLEQIADLTKKLGESTPPKGKGKTETPDDDGPLSAVLATIGDLAESVKALKEDRDGEKAQAQTRQIASAFVEATYPNLKGKEQLRDRLILAGVKTEDEAKAKATGVLDEWRAAGVDVDKQISASPEGEGGTSESDDDEATRKQERIEKIRGRVKTTA